MDAYAIMELFRDSRLEHIAIIKSKFSENRTPLLPSQGNNFS